MAAVSIFGLDPKLETQLPDPKVENSLTVWQFTSVRVFCILAKFEVLDSATFIRNIKTGLEMTCNMNVRFFKQVVLTYNQSQLNAKKIVKFVILCYLKLTENFLF